MTAEPSFIYTDFCFIGINLKEFSTDIQIVYHWRVLPYELIGHLGDVFASILQINIKKRVKILSDPYFSERNIVSFISFVGFWQDS